MADPRKIAIASVGFCAFLNLYSPQALLPELARAFGVGAAEISTVLTASTLAIALTAPFTGALADVLGRKRVIASAMFAVVIPMAGAALAADVPTLIAWRFLQGLLLPPAFLVTVAYIGDEWPPNQVATGTGAYFVGTSLGGVGARFIPGALADALGWRIAFLVIAGLTFVGAALVMLLLPREKGFVRSHGIRSSTLQIVRHLGNLQLLSGYAIGFGTLFNFVAVFTYVGFYLAAPPFSFSSTLLGAIFITYLTGVFVAPATGRMIAMLGRRTFLLLVIATWTCGCLLTLAPSVIAIITGLTLCAACGMASQTTATSYVTAIAKGGRSSAVGLYVTAYYAGGSMGAFLPGLVWNSSGWPACVLIVIGMLVAMAVIASLCFAPYSDVVEAQ